MKLNDAMNLETLTRDLTPIQLVGALDKTVTQLTFDSRLAGPGTLFVAQKGPNQTGMHTWKTWRQREQWLWSANNFLPHCILR